MIRKATIGDIDGIVKIYDEIHDAEENGKLTVGWMRNVYPIKTTATEALDEGTLFVYEQDGEVLASAIINQRQLDSYFQAAWTYEAPADRVTVLHTLTVSPSAMKKGIGDKFVDFYEAYAKQCGCTTLRLDTQVKNAVARHFYPQRGYREAGIVECGFFGIEKVTLMLFEKRVCM